MSILRPCLVEVKKIFLEKWHPSMYNEVDIYKNHVRVNGIERDEYFLKNYNESEIGSNRTDSGTLFVS